MPSAESLYLVIFAVGGTYKDYHRDLSPHPTSRTIKVRDLGGQGGHFVHCPNRSGVVHLCGILYMGVAIHRGTLSSPTP